MKKTYISILIALMWASLASADLFDGLVMYMPLDEGNGKTTEDFSANGFKGEFKGNPKWVDGKMGKALQFSASNDFVFVADNKAFHIEDAITQAAWINLDRLPSAHAIVFGTRSGGGRNIGFGYGMNPGNGIKVWTNNDAGGFLDINDNKTKLKTGQWYYLAYTHTTAGSGLVEIYVDGKVSHSQKSNNPVGPAGAPNEVTIGTWAGEAWPGIVDEARLWNRALSPKEVEESMELDAATFLAVQPNGKLATSWAQIKRGR
jgi:hypothetical protein